MGTMCVQWCHESACVKSGPLQGQGGLTSPWSGVDIPKESSEGGGLRWLLTVPWGRTDTSWVVKQRRRESGR